jgi:hypothetical protein
MMRISGFLALLLTLTSPARATLVPGTERPVTTPTPDVAAFNQSRAKIASDGDGFLAVWIDHAFDGTGDIHGALLTSEGNRVSDDVLRIAGVAADEQRVAVASGGGRYLVVWSMQGALRARLVSPDGSMSDVPEIESVPFATTPHIAFNGSRFCVVWFDGTLFRGATISTTGDIIRKFNVASLGQTTNDQALVAMNGSFHFVTSETDFNGVPGGNGYPADVGVTRIAENGDISPRVVIAPAATPVFDLKAASNGAEMLIGWTTAIGIPGATVRNVRFNSAGAGAVEAIPAEGMYLQDIVAEPAGFLFFYGDDTTKFMRRPGAAAPIGTVSTPPGDTAILDSANNGTRTVVVVRGKALDPYEHWPHGGDLYATRLDTMAIEPIVVAPRHQSSPDVAAAGDLRLAAWCEYIGSERRLGVVATRLAADGSAIAVDAIDLKATVARPVSPRVASNGTDWLVAWLDGTKLYGSRIARNGTLLDAAPFLIASGVFDTGDVSLSWDGTQYVIAYVSGQFLRGVQTRPYASLVPAQGTAIAEIALASEIAANEYAAVASSPAGSLIVWRNRFTLHGALLSRSGIVTPLAFALTPELLARPSVAWNGDTYLVAAPFRGVFGFEIQWMRISAEGTVNVPVSTFLDVDTSGLTQGTATVDVEASGDGFLVYFHAAVADATVYAARITRQGVLAEGPVAVGSTGFPYFGSSIGAAGNLVLYARRIGHPTRDLTRVFAREVLQLPGKPRRRAASH